MTEVCQNAERWALILETAFEKVLVSHKCNTGIRKDQVRNAENLLTLKRNFPQVSV